MKKRIVSLLLILALVFSMCITASAQDIPDTEEASPIVILPEDYMGGEESQIAPFDLKPPSDWHDLRIESYEVNLTSVGSARLYTNRTFSPDADQRLYVTFTVYAKKNTTTFKVGYYDITAGKDFGLPYVVNNLGTSAQTFTIYAFEMNPSHKYAIYFISDGAVAAGDGRVFHGA